MPSQQGSERRRAQPTDSQWTSSKTGGFAGDLVDESRMIAYSSGGGSALELALGFVRIGYLDVAVWLHTAIDPSDLEWRDAFQRAEQVLKARGDAALVRNFVVSDGGAPNTAQRGYMRKHLEGVSSTVVTNSLSNPIKRGIATALTWLSKRHGFFPPAEARRALDHLGLSGSLDLLWDELLSLQKLMPPNETLRLMAEALNFSAPLSPLAIRVGT